MATGLLNDTITSSDNSILPDGSKDDITPELLVPPPVFLDLEESESDVSKTLSSIETKEEPLSTLD
jgi:hypothetical protein